MRRMIISILVMMVGMDLAFGQEGSQDQQEMMKKWQVYMTPGKYHKQLAYYEGAWTYKGKIWMTPQTPPSEMSGTANGKMILGGRYLQLVYKGMSMGALMEGINITAFDNHLEKFQSTWIDNMGTGIFVSMGKPGDGKVREEVGEADDPMGSGMVRMRNVFTILSADSFKMEMFNKNPGMAEYKSMELVFTRKK